MILFLLLLLTNLWFLRTFSYSVPLAVVLVFSSITFYFFLKKRLPLRWFLLPFIILVVWTFSATTKASLSGQSEIQKIHTQQRLNSYPPIYIIPLAHWLEAKPETLIFYKLQHNFFEVLDPGLYFFSNHPRQRIGFEEFEKFSYVLLPFFVLGLLKRPSWTYLTPLFVLAYLGNNTPLGPLVLFPFIFGTTLIGVESIKSKRALFVVFIGIYFLSFIQTLTYENF